MERTKALIVPGIEDFGITPVEANAAGAPVIAYRGGGVLESIIEKETGIFFANHTPAAVETAIHEFSETQFSPIRCRENAIRFDEEVFTEAIRAIIEDLSDKSCN